MRIKCLAQGNNILLPGFEPSTSVSNINILANRPICQDVDDVMPSCRSLPAANEIIPNQFKEAINDSYISFMYINVARSKHGSFMDPGGNYI